MLPLLRLIEWPARHVRRRSDMKRLMVRVETQVYVDFLGASGIEPGDPRLDWARDESDPKKALDRWRVSISTIKDAIAKNARNDV